MLNRRCVPHLLAAGLIAVSLTVSGCGGKDKPAVCGDVEALQSSVSALSGVKVEQGALPELKTKLAQVQTDAQKLKTDAESQYASQISAVDSAAKASKTALDAAVANPSTSTIAGLVATLPALKTALSNLESAVKSTC
jgi:hypothetical protein